jgi:signal transduction histidine kinase
MFNQPKSISGVFTRGIWFLFLVIFAGIGFVGQAQSKADYPVSIETLTNILQVRNLAFLEKASSCYVRLEGVVLWVNPIKDELILQDNTGGVMMKVDLRNHPEVQPGEKILIEGSCLNTREGLAFGILIDNDGIHASTEKSGMLFLSKGLHPISVEWFNGPANFDLELDYMGPGISRQKIPDMTLFRKEMDLASGTNRLVQGLDCRDYEGNWDRLPDFSRLPVLKRGTVTNFDLQFRTRDENVGLLFSGYFDASRDGKYRFWLGSDDGSKLYIGDRPLKLKAFAKTTLPSPFTVFPGSPVPQNHENQWGAVEGIVTHVSEEYGNTFIELTSDTGRAYLKFVNGDRNYLKSLLHSRIKVAGIGRNVSDTAGQMMPSLLVPDISEVTVVQSTLEQWPDFPVVPIGNLTKSFLSGGVGKIVHVIGTVYSNSMDNSLIVGDKTGKILLDISQTPPAVGDEIEVLGWLKRLGSNVVLWDGSYREISPKVDSNTEVLPLLTKVIQIKSLSRTEAQRGYPVKIRGVVTANVGAHFVIQDSTASVYVQWDGSVIGDSPRVGDYWQIEGETFIDFAPNVKVHSADYLLPGILPEPLLPSKDELINGSLDTRYIELEGFVTDVEGDDLTLLTREGKIKLTLHTLEPISLEKIKNAHVRVRGVNSLSRDKSQRMLAPLSLYSASVSVDELASTSPYQIPLKPVSDLLMFDFHADTLQQVKITGQILHERNGEYFLADGTNGLRFDLKSPLDLQAGEMVEAVGFPDISGPSPILHEALVRVIGQTNLPPAQRLFEDTMLDGKYDATLVCIRSRLIGLSADRSDQIMELQTGTQRYVARLAKNRGFLNGILPGSFLELTGTYAGHGGDRASGRDIDSFELLLNSPSDIRVLARPSWWTFRHAMALIGGMVFVILAALVWITLLHRQVKEQTTRLTIEIKGREQTEYQRALEEERARIASDLHDQLGAALTEIRFLGVTESRDLSVPAATRSLLVKVSEKSRQMVSSLDEIVWAINPANDSLANLADYLCQAAEEFFSATEIRCRLDVDESLPSVPLTSEVRHNLYLVVREALNNIAKHSRATEAWLRIHWKDQILQVFIEDNGCGFDNDFIFSGNGLPNMRRRLEKIGGRFEIDRQPDSGMVCRICLPLSKNEA